MLYLADESGKFVWDCIERMTENKYWNVFEGCLTAAREKIPTKCGIGETFFTYIAVIGEKLYSNNPKNINNFHKDINDLVLVIINIGYYKIVGGAV